MISKAEKNKQIGESGRITREKRKSQICKTFKFKVNKSSLSKEQANQLKMIFVEGKWVYNYLLANSDNLFDVGTKYKELTNITKKDQQGNDIPVAIQYLGSSIKQNIIEQICSSIKGLSALKKKGHNVGKLKFKSEIKQIGLKQYGITHSIRGNRIKIQGIKKPIRVYGIEQLSIYENIDYTVGKILFDGYDYWISLTCYVDKSSIPVKTYKNEIVGIDMGLETTVTCSNGDKYNVLVEETDRLKKLQAKLARKQKRSNNWYKTKSKLNKEYAHITNIKADKANKIVSKILSENAIIVMQDEQIDSWKHTENKYAAKDRCQKIQHSILGRVKSKLRMSDRVIMLDQWFPTSKYCFDCERKHGDLKVTDRVFECPYCGVVEDRDVHAAKNMVAFYLRYKDAVGTTGTSKPAIIKFRKEFVVQQEDATSLALC